MKAKNKFKETEIGKIPEDFKQRENLIKGETK